MRKLAIAAILTLATLAACASPTAPKATSTKPAVHDDGPTCRGGYVIAYINGTPTCVPDDQATSASTAAP